GLQNQSKTAAGISSRGAGQQTAIGADALQGGTWQNPPPAATGNSTVGNSLAGSALASAAANGLSSANAFPSASQSPLSQNSLPPSSLSPNDASPAALTAEGYGKPGDKKLEGAQTPSVTIEKIAPSEIQVGKPAKFQVLVKNTGPVPAESVEVT